jgi:hypothetical protein
MTNSGELAILPYGMPRMLLLPPGQCAVSRRVPLLDRRVSAYNCSLDSPLWWASWFAPSPVANRFAHFGRLILLKTPLTERYPYRKGNANRFLV